MIITCPYCDKQFNVDASLIPKNGRNLQCGLCDRRWFYSFPKQTSNDDVLELESIDTLNEKITNYDEANVSKDTISNKKDESRDTNKTTRGFNFKILFFYIILLVALVILIDTFKLQISLFYPNINNIMDSLYETLKDLNLFFIDLTR
tara:strand:- start:536 stop:979 length:444 start_codon:yes stop_codon:yes gene_type:complete